MAKRPILLVTVCRRYYELEKNLRFSQTLFGEFNQAPEVVVVWARPEIGRLWVFEKLLAEGQISRVMGRPALPDEVDGCATTFPESRNLRGALESFRRLYAPDSYYVIGQAADVCPKKGVYSYIDSTMQDGRKAVAFLMPICHSLHAWHTNFFAVASDDAFWPPVSPTNSQDILERQWAVVLDGKENVERSNNNNNKHFVHAHESESAKPYPFFAQDKAAVIGLTVRGYETWLSRCKKYLRRTYQWLKSISFSTPSRKR